MAHGTKTIPIPIELSSGSNAGVVVSADAVYDYNIRQNQETLNSITTNLNSRVQSLETQISILGNQFEYEFADQKPEASSETMYKIYFIPSEELQNVVEQWVTFSRVVNEQTEYYWEKIGNSQINLSGYYTSAEIDSLLHEAEQNLNQALLEVTSGFTADIEEIYAQVDQIDEFQPEWAPNGALQDANIDTLNRLMLVPKENPDKENFNIADKYITVRVNKYGPLGSWEGEEIENATEYEYFWEKIGSNDTFEVINLGSIWSDWDSYDINTSNFDLNKIWKNNKIPVIKVILERHSVSPIAIPLYETSEGVFEGIGILNRGAYLVTANFTKYNNKIYVSPVGTENASNKTIYLSQNSTNTEYPSAKCVYDAIQELKVRIEALEGGISESE